MMQQLLYRLVVVLVVVAFSSLWNGSVILMQITLGLNIDYVFNSLIDVLWDDLVKCLCLAFCSFAVKC